MSDQAAFMRAYRLPDQIARTEQKLIRLKAEYHGIRADVLAARTHIFSAAWEQAILTAKKEAQERGEDWSMGVDQC